MISLRLLCAVLSALFFVNLLSAEDGYWWVNNRHRNPTKGGWVSNGAYVEEGVFIAPTARVENSATVTGQVRIYGNAIVRGQATVEGSARVYGNAVIEDNAMVGDGAQVFDHAQISGDAYIGGEAKVGGYARIKTGQITAGVHRPPKTAEMIAAERTAAERARRERERQDAREAAERRREEIVAALDWAIKAANEGRTHEGTGSYIWRANNRTYYVTTRVTHRPNLRRVDHQLVFELENSKRVRDTGSKSRNSDESHEARGTVAIRSIKPGEVHERNGEYYRLVLRMPEGSVYLRDEDNGRYSEVRRGSELNIESDSRAVLENLRKAILNFQTL
jgi:UDP-3-O-[3-hydroxymyristoyl] glucosamine N-acyltransferase